MPTPPPLPPQSCTSSSARRCASPTSASVPLSACLIWGQVSGSEQGAAGLRTAAAGRSCNPAARPSVAASTRPPSSHPLHQRLPPALRHPGAAGLGPGQRSRDGAHCVGVPPWVAEARRSRCLEKRWAVGGPLPSRARRSSHANLLMPAGSATLPRPAHHSGWRPQWQPRGGPSGGTAPTGRWPPRRRRAFA